MVILVLIFILTAFFFIMMAGSSRQTPSATAAEKLSIALVSPIQSAAGAAVAAVSGIWTTYFMAVQAVEENRKLKHELGRARKLLNKNRELLLENQRLKKFVNFTGSVEHLYVAARVIARDPSPWFKTIMIDKGTEDGLLKGNPVMVSEGVVGQIIEVSDHYAKVLLITDRNSAVDGLIQSTRVRGIVKGDSSDNCYFVYALKKEDIEQGQVIVSSGMDQVFPKGLEIGTVQMVEKKHSQLFQKITIRTSVDFDKLEEVLILKQSGDSLNIGK